MKSLKFTNLNTLILLLFTFFIQESMYSQRQHKKSKKEVSKHLNTPSSPFYFSVGGGANVGPNVYSGDASVMLGVRYKKSVIALGTGLKLLTLIDDSQYDVDFPITYLPQAIEYKYYFFKESATPFLSFRATRFNSIELTLFAPSDTGVAWSTTTAIGYRFASTKRSNTVVTVGYEGLYDNTIYSTRKNGKQGVLGDVHLLNTKFTIEF